jgi:hypothetical protein
MISPKFMCKFSRNFWRTNVYSLQIIGFTYLHVLILYLPNISKQLNWRNQHYTKTEWAINLCNFFWRMIQSWKLGSYMVRYCFFVCQGNLSTLSTNVIQKFSPPSTCWWFWSSTLLLTTEWYHESCLLPILLCKADALRSLRLQSLANYVTNSSK